jgi:hypothetical protein
MEGIKTCIVCKEEKFENDFFKSKKELSGRLKKCKYCVKKQREQTNKCGIYKITSPTDNIYIGQSKNIKSRWSSYRTRGCEQQVVLSKSFIKYGVDNHKFEIVEECEKEFLDIRERYWQEYYGVVGRKGLNCHYTKN